MKVHCGASSADKQPVESRPIFRLNFPSEPKHQLPSMQSPENGSLKAKQEQKQMFLKEINDFQNELYNFKLKSKEIQANIQRDIDCFNLNIDINLLDELRLKRESSIDDLKRELVLVKLELAGACCVITGTGIYFKCIYEKPTINMSFETGNRQLCLLNLKLKALSISLYQKICEISSSKVQLRQHFECEKKLMVKLAQALAISNMGVNAAKQPFLPPKDKHVLTPALSLSELISEMNDMVNQISALSFKSSTTDVPTPTPAPIFSNKPLPHTTLDPKPTKIDSGTSKAKTTDSSNNLVSNLVGIKPLLNNNNLNGFSFSNPTTLLQKPLPTSTFEPPVMKPVAPTSTEKQMPAFEFKPANFSRPKTSVVLPPNTPISSLFGITPTAANDLDLINHSSGISFPQPPKPTSTFKPLLYKQAPVSGEKKMPTFEFKPLNISEISKPKITCPPNKPTANLNEMKPTLAEKLGSSLPTTASQPSTSYKCNPAPIFKITPLPMFEFKPANNVQKNTSKAKTSNPPSQEYKFASIFEPPLSKPAPVSAEKKIPTFRFKPPNISETDPKTSDPPKKPVDNLFEVNPTAANKSNFMPASSTSLNFEYSNSKPPTATFAKTKWQWPAFEFKLGNVQTETSKSKTSDPLNNPTGNLFGTKPTHSNNSNPLNLSAPTQASQSAPFKFEYPNPKSTATFVKIPWPTFESIPATWPTNFEFKPANINGVTIKPRSSDPSTNPTSNLFGINPKAANNSSMSGTTHVSFRPVDDKYSDCVTERYQCITCMNEYSKKSLEELRLEDYRNNGLASREGLTPRVPFFPSSPFQQQKRKEFFGITSLGTSIVKFEPLIGTDVNKRNESIQVKHQCITCMKCYQNKSLEELRLEDYIARDSTQSVFGSALQQKIRRKLRPVPINRGTTIVEWNPLLETVDIVQDGICKLIIDRYISITCMKEYEHKSQEELRHEDYLKGLTPVGLFRLRQQRQNNVAAFGVTKIPTDSTQAPVFEVPKQKSQATDNETATQQCNIPTQKSQAPEFTAPAQRNQEPEREATNQQCNIPTQKSQAPEFATPTQRNQESEQEKSTQQCNKPMQKSQVPEFEITTQRSHETLADEKKEAGVRLYEQKKYEEAVEMFSEAIKLCSENPVYFTKRAAALTELGKHRKALEDLQKAVDLDPMSTASYISLANCCLTLGDIATGEQALRRASELSGPDSVRLERSAFAKCREMQEYARKQMDLRKYYDALNSLNTCLKSFCHACSKTKLMKAECLAMVNRYQEAQDIAINISYFERSDADAFYILGLCSFYQDKEEQAVKHFKKALDLARDHEKAQVMHKKAKQKRNEKLLKLKREQGNEAFKKDNFQEALDLYNEALKIDPNNKEENAKLHYNKATVYAKLKETMKSAQACTEALELDGNYVKALLRRAQCYTELEDHEAAVEDYEKLNKMNPSQENERLLDEANKTLKKYKKSNFYYKILGIKTTASEDDIKKAYRTCARLYHPDRHRDSGNAVIHVMERKFKQVGEAHAVLSDPQKRAQYDRSQCDDDDEDYDDDDGDYFSGQYSRNSRYSRNTRYYDDDDDEDDDDDYSGYYN